MHRTILPNRHVVAGCLLVLLAALFAVPPSLEARESRALDNDITIDAGFITEPPIQNDTNGLEIVVTTGAKPVEGLEATLSAQAIFAGEARELPLTPVDGTPGTYTSVFIPTQPGEYSFRVHGTITDQPVDETFHTSPEGVPLVASRLDYEFPTAAHGRITNLAWPAGATLLSGIAALYLVRRQRSRA